MSNDTELRIVCKNRLVAEYYLGGGYCGKAFDIAFKKKEIKILQVVEAWGTEFELDKESFIDYVHLNSSYTKNPWWSLLELDNTSIFYDNTPDFSNYAEWPRQSAKWWIVTGQ